ncbi:hypothetical protein Patl1_03760 [Pistacia atlantica]|uniref:Uncharacterized protein n=1 Tax=Pistacia atlantica TaxID=434234 RepID=A0ACC1BSR3_9ROSI|nr:hypothetical protein Patl1_03760 [Pistacia atlantica]
MAPNSKCKCKCKCSTSTTAKYSTTKSTTSRSITKSTTTSRSITKSTTTSRSITKPATTTKKIDHGQKHKKIGASSSAPKAKTSQCRHHYPDHHYHRQISKPKAPKNALTQPKPTLGMANAGATFKSTTTKATLRLGQGVEFEMVTEEAVFIDGQLVFIRVGCRSYEGILS